MIRKIFQRSALILRRKAEEVNFAEMKTARFKQLVFDMQETLEAEDDGVALAAPQVGLSKRLFVVSPKAFLDGPERIAPGDLNNKELQKELEQISAKEHLIYINPILIKQSTEKHKRDEGCLSVRWLYGKVLRSTRATVRATDEKGEVFVRGASGLLAHIFQHEVDHLDGKLFLDNASDLREIPPEDQ